MLLLLLLLVALQNLLSGNVTRVSTLRYGDAKTLPAIDVHLWDGLDSVPKKLMQGLNITYNTGTLSQQSLLQ
jgi:hypothetical protein